MTDVRAADRGLELGLNPSAHISNLELKTDPAGSDSSKAVRILIWKLTEGSDLLKVMELLMESLISQRLLFLL